MRYLRREGQAPSAACREAGRLLRVCKGYLPTRLTLPLIRLSEPIYIPSGPPSSSSRRQAMQGGGVATGRRIWPARATKTIYRSPNVGGGGGGTAFFCVLAWDCGEAYIISHQCQPPRHQFFLISFFVVKLIFNYLFKLKNLPNHRLSPRHRVLGRDLGEAGR